MSPHDDHRACLYKTAITGFRSSAPGRSRATIPQIHPFLLNPEILPISKYDTLARLLSAKSKKSGFAVLYLATERAFIFGDNNNPPFSKVGMIV